MPATRRTRVLIGSAALAVAGLVAVLMVWPSSPGTEPAVHRVLPTPTQPTTQPTAQPTMPTPTPLAPTPHRRTVRFMTANVPFTLSGESAYDQIGHVLLSAPDVVVLNEVKHRRVSRDLEKLQPGAWGVLQPRGDAAETAVLWRTDRFTAARHGVRLGSSSRYGDSRYLPWVVLHDQVTHRDVTVVGLHFPTNASKYAGMRTRYQAMNSGLTGLVRRLHRLGHPIVAGGDWNHPLRQTRESWSPVPTLRSVGLTTNWRVGLPCRGTSHYLGQIDGFALSPTLRLTDQGCLARRHSDHRPVWMDVSLTAYLR